MRSQENDHLTSEFGPPGEGCIQGVIARGGTPSLLRRGWRPIDNLGQVRDNSRRKVDPEKQREPPQRQISDDL